MLAAHLVQSGPPEDAMEIVTKDIPEPASDEVRLEVEACGMQHADVLQRKSFPTESITGPHQMGTEIAGIVDAVGAEVTDWSVGDRVNVYHRVSCGRCEWCGKGEDTMCIDSRKIGTDLPGGFGEYVAVPASSLNSIPDSMDFVTAAAYSSSFTTAWRMMVTAGELRPSERALILGASGGVGNAALQIAERVGAFTFATTSTPEKAKRLDGEADHIINYEEEPFDEAVRELTDGRGVDLVADHVGQKTWQKSINSLAKNGRMMICGATTGPNPDINIRSIYQHHRKIIGAPLGSRQDFHDVGRLIAAGELTPKIDRVLPLERIAEGHRAIEDREIVGKVVIQP